jgi:hypothetical protein
MKRDYSIDILKCLAAFIITWSHFEKPLGDYSYLATGGAFGDALFFFCSGYTIFLGRKTIGFLNWYKNRINRIYPTVFAWALLRCLLYSNTSDNILDIIICGGGFFVSCIMIFYVFFYFIKKYAVNHLYKVLIASTILTTCSYFILDNNDTSVMYKWQWSLFFAVMLLGGIIGKERRERETKEIEHVGIAPILLLGLSIAVYYILLFIEQKSGMQMIRMFTIFPLMLFAYSLHKLCTGNLAFRMYKNKYSHLFLMTIGSLCLEIYLVQPRLLTDAFNHLFPFNLILMYLIIFIAAYLLRCVSRIWMQTFKDADYDWKIVFKPY